MLQIPKKGEKLIIDFNYAYNPYSSYNDNWDCPITPEENILPVAIKAGEKKFSFFKELTSSAFSLIRRQE